MPRVETHLKVPKVPPEPLRARVCAHVQRRSLRDDEARGESRTRAGVRERSARTGGLGVPPEQFSDVPAAVVPPARQFSGDESGRRRRIHVRPGTVDGEVVHEQEESLLGRLVLGITPAAAADRARTARLRPTFGETGREPRHARGEPLCVGEARQPRRQRQGARAFETLYRPGNDRRLAGVAFPEEGHVQRTAQGVRDQRRIEAHLERVDYDAGPVIGRHRPGRSLSRPCRHPGEDVRHAVALRVPPAPRAARGASPESAVLCFLSLGRQFSGAAHGVVVCEVHLEFKRVVIFFVEREELTRRDVVVQLVRRDHRLDHNQTGGRPSPFQDGGHHARLHRIQRFRRTCLKDAPHLGVAPHERSNVAVRARDGPESTVEEKCVDADVWQRAGTVWRFRSFQRRSEQPRQSLCRAEPGRSVGLCCLGGRRGPVAFAAALVLGMRVDDDEVRVQEPLEAVEERICIVAAQERLCKLPLENFQSRQFDVQEERAANTRPAAASVAHDQLC
mmetsp:Transcript_1436/g.5176  ORF Transcript_1436/g.5176 Transcript_1436/m.5176 type:complete len:506 (-) Transcript_1436:2071-3588(-)